MVAVQVNNYLHKDHLIMKLRFIVFFLARPDEDSLAV